MASSSAPVDREGFLNKRGDKLNKSFKKRWFVLTGTELKYYKTKEGASGKEQGKIELDGVGVEICPEANYKKKFVFEVTSPAQSRVFILEAESGSSAQEWMTAIRQAMLKIRREKAKSANAARKEEKEATEVETDPSQAAAIDLTSQYAKKKDATEDDKYDVYRQWLDESKDSNKGKKGTGGGQAIRKGLLSDDDQPPQNQGGCCSSCVVQ